MLEHQSSLQKALTLNLDPKIYGTFAEIGAGQEVVGNFFKAGGASGTVAKSISAYDMVISDTIYGREKSKRYVCKSRVEKMMKYEFNLLVERLTAERKDTQFFAYANTISARNYHGTNEAHGWQGVRFQDKEGNENEIVVHTLLHDNTNQLQQVAVGILGVNMLHCCFNLDKLHSCSDVVDALMDQLGRERVEIDLIDVRGPLFNQFDARLLNLELVKRGLTSVISFGPKGNVVLPKDELYKKNILVARGSYRPPTKVNVDLLNSSLAQFESDIKSDDVQLLCEISIANLAAEGEIAPEDFLARVDLLSDLNYRVMISNFPKYDGLSQYLRRFKSPHVALVLGAYNFQLMLEGRSEDNVLESLGRLLKKPMRLYLYPYKENDSDTEIISLKHMPVSKEVLGLFNYIKETFEICDIDGFDPDLLHIWSRKVLNMIINNEAGWEDLVPKKTAKAINDKCLFGHPCFKAS